ncbi:MAG: hypothetical protein ACREUO_07260 [Burkholderiales bacterium]
MIVALLVFALAAAPALALTPEAKEFMQISKQLEPVQCEKRKLRREIALAQAERREADARAARTKFAALNRDEQTARLEKRLAELERRISDGRGATRDPEDLEVISAQRRRAFYACD